MGVDANYVYGYMAKIEDVIWDIDYLKSRFNLNEHLSGWLKEYTYGDLVQWLEEDEVDDWCDVEEILGIKKRNVYDEEYLYFDHFDVIKTFPDRKLGELDILAKEYAKQCGVKNVEVFTWKEFGYFD